MNFTKGSRLKIFLLLIGVFLVLSACGSDESNSARAPGIQTNEETEANKKFTEVITDFGTLCIPQEHKQELETRIVNGENGCVVKFSTELNGVTYALFDVSIGKENGQFVGSITDSNNTSREVYISVHEITDINDLTQDEQDNLYALQETVNVVVENLK